MLGSITNHEEDIWAIWYIEDTVKQNGRKKTPRCGIWTNDSGDSLKKQNHLFWAEQQKFADPSNSTSRQRWLTQETSISLWADLPIPWMLGMGSWSCRLLFFPHLDGTWLNIASKRWVVDDQRVTVLAGIFQSWLIADGSIYYDTETKAFFCDESLEKRKWDITSERWGWSGI